MAFIRHPLADPTHPGRRQALARSAVPDAGVRDAGVPDAGVEDAGGGSAVELVVLVDEAGRQIGTADKATVHGPSTARHLAFSCYGFDAAGRLLVTQRARTKSTFPAVWTNTCCGHPAPGEALADAAARRLAFELGLTVTDMRVVLPDFSYRASDGRVEENEFCPVLVCTIVGEPSARPDEVEATAWWSWRQFLDAAAAPGSQLSPWAREQAPLLDAALFAGR